MRRPVITATMPSPGALVAESRPDGGAGGPRVEVIEVRVPELRHLFNAIDPSPVHEKELESRVEEFIVRWARDLPRDAPLELTVHLDRASGAGDDAGLVREAVREFFGYRAQAARQSLRQLFRVGRKSLAIGLACLAGSVLIGDVITKVVADDRLGHLFRESLLIGGWVAMWRPMEIFLYDWWPIRAEGMLYTRLSEMVVRIACVRGAVPDGSAAVTLRHGPDEAR